MDETRLLQAPSSLVTMPGSMLGTPACPKDSVFGDGELECAIPLCIPWAAGRTLWHNPSPIPASPGSGRGAGCGHEGPSLTQGSSPPQAVGWENMAFVFLNRFLDLCDVSGLWGDGCPQNGATTGPQPGQGTPEAPAPSTAACTDGESPQSPPSECLEGSGDPHTACGSTCHAQPWPCHPGSASVTLLVPVSPSVCQCHPECANVTQQQQLGENKSTQLHLSLL